MKYTFLLRRASFFLFTLLFFVAAGSAYAVDRCWDGGGTTNNWSEDANWAGNVEPGTGDVAVFDNGTCSGTPNKNATVDGVIEVLGINIVAYSGTISISDPNMLALGSSGFTQAAGTFDIGTGVVVSQGNFTRTGGSFSGGSGTYPQGTYAHYMTSSTFSGSTTFHHLAFGTNTGVQADNIASGTTLTVAGLLLIDGTSDPNDILNGPGGISAQGDITVAGAGFEGANASHPGDVVITINGTGSQTLTGEADTDSQIPSVTINKSSGTLSIVDTVVVGGNWTYSQGSISPGSSTIIFDLNGDYTLSGTHSLNNITVRSALSFNPGATVSSGTTITALGNLSFDGSYDNNDTLSGPGGFAVQGSLSTVTDGVDSDVPITLNGTNSQTITLNGTTFTTGNITINKSSGTVTLGAAMTLDGTGQDLTISSGILDMSTYALTVDDVITVNGGLIQNSGNLTASNGNMTIGTTGWWVNNSTGDFVMDGGDTLTNNGYTRLDGTSAGCGGTDGIVFTRSGAGSVNLAGSGRWRVYDVGFSNYAASPALTVYSSTNTAGNTGITFTGTCPSEVTWDGGGGDTNYNTGANWTGDTAPGATDLAVLDATSTKNMTINTDPADNGFQINLGYSGTMTQSNGVDIVLDDQGWEQNAGTFTGGNNTSDMLVQNGGNFILNSGTFTAPTGTFEFYDNFTVGSGTFTHNSGTLKTHLEGNDSQTFTGSFTANNLNIYGDICCNPSEVIVASGTTITVNGTLTFDDNASDQRNYLQGPGAIHAKGPVTVLNNGFMDEYSTNNSSVVINGTGNQTITGISGIGNASLPNLTINKTSGDVTFVDRVGIFGNFTFTDADSVISTGSTVEFWGEDSETYTITGSITLNNVTFHYDECCNDATHTLASGTTITANGNLLIEQLGSRTDSGIDGPGGLDVKGDVTVSGDVCQAGCTATLTMSGSSDANLINGSTTGFLDGTITINKSSGTVTLGSTLNLDGSGQDLTITDGTLANSSYALTVNDTFTINDTFTQGTGNVSATSYTVGATGAWTNTSTGDVTVGTGGVSNSGVITLGDINTCGGANNIAITSSSGGNQRSWSGSGSFNIYDTTVQDQGGSASITAYSSQNVSGNGGNWTFNDTCPSPDVMDARLRGGATLRGGAKLL